MAQLKINGQTVAASSGQTVLEAAREAGIVIPTLCYHPDLSPAGSCRMCLVEVDRMPHPMAACKLPAADGMHAGEMTRRVEGLMQLYPKTLVEISPDDVIDVWHARKMKVAEDHPRRHAMGDDSPSRHLTAAGVNHNLRPLGDTPSTGD